MKCPLFKQHHPFRLYEALTPTNIFIWFRDGDLHYFVNIKPFMNLMGWDITLRDPQLASLNASYYKEQ